MTGLLVSVRSGEEAAAALAGGADLIDVKEPRGGSLGAASPNIWDEVCHVVNRKTPISVALGELLQGDSEDETEKLATRMLVHRANDIQYVKIGLAGCRELQDWEHLWGNALKSLPQQVVSVAVAYADWREASAPQPQEVLRQAAILGCGAFLMDTYRKSGGGLFEHATKDQLYHLVEAAKKDQMIVVLAGSLTQRTISQALRLEPDFVAVRGAACNGQRTGAIDVRRVKELAALLSAYSEIPRVT